jgi:hypothetical protein
LVRLVGLNTRRIFPGVFMVLRLDGPFPQSAGWGDVIVGLTAIPLVAATARNFSKNRGAVLVWNILGTLDLVTAVSLGVSSAPGSPLQPAGVSEAFADRFMVSGTTVAGIIATVIMLGTCGMRVQSPMPLDL